MRGQALSARTIPYAFLIISLAILPNQHVKMVQKAWGSFFMRFNLSTYTASNWLKNLFFKKKRLETEMSTYRNFHSHIIITLYLYFRCLAGFYNFPKIESAMWTIQERRSRLVSNAFMLDNFKLDRTKKKDTWEFC